MAEIHRGVAELRAEEPGVKAELDVIVDKIESPSYHLTNTEAQALLDAVEAKLRELSR